MPGRAGAAPAFLSIGTNDLTQFLFAADRANPKLAERYDWLSPAILRFLRRVVTTVAPHGTLVTVCGEMGGRRLEALALLGLGIDRLSITPAAVGPIKELVRQIDTARSAPRWTAGWPRRRRRCAHAAGMGRRAGNRLRIELDRRDSSPELPQCGAKPLTFAQLQRSPAHWDNPA
jgi:hypothetical protein